MSAINEFRAEAFELCPVCGGAVKMRISFPGSASFRIVPSVCACWQRKADEDALKREEDRRTYAEKKRYDAAFCGRVLQGDFDADDGRNPELMDACMAYVEMFDGIRCQKVNGLLLHGPTREGKTFAAEAVARKLHESGRKVLMDTAAGFVQRIQSSSGTERDVLMRRISKCDLLVIDDFGASRDTSFGREAIFSVIDARVSANGPMIATTNLSALDMAGAESLDDKRCYYRIMERCLQVEANTGASFADNADHGKLAGMIFKS